MPSAPQTATAGAFGAEEASDEVTVWGQLLYSASYIAIHTARFRAVQMQCLS